MPQLPKLILSYRAAKSALAILSRWFKRNFAWLSVLALALGTILVWIAFQDVPSYFTHFLAVGALILSALPETMKRATPMLFIGLAGVSVFLFVAYTQSKIQIRLNHIVVGFAPKYCRLAKIGMCLAADIADTPNSLFACQDKVASGSFVPSPESFRETKIWPSIPIAPMFIVDMELVNDSARQVSVAEIVLVTGPKTGPTYGYKATGIYEGTPSIPDSMQDVMPQLGLFRRQFVAPYSTKELVVSFTLYPNVDAELTPYGTTVPGTYRTKVYVDTQRERFGREIRLELPLSEQAFYELLSGCQKAVISPPTSMLLDLLPSSNLHKPILLETPLNRN